MNQTELSKKLGVSKAYVSMVLNGKKKPSNQIATRLKRMGIEVNSQVNFEANTSIADLIRKAVEAVYGEDIEDIRVMEEEIAKYQAHPESAISLDELRRRKKVNV